MLRACVALCARLTVWRNLVRAPSQVKWFDRKKGIGFATPAAGGDDIFIHRRNFTTQFTLDENDEVFYDVGEYEGRPTAIKISVPPDKVSKAPPRRVRGRNAKKSLDEEAETVAVEKDAEALAEQSAPAAPAAEGAATGDKPGGGRDSKTRRRPNSGNRERRNDKGLGGQGSVSDGKGSARRSEARNEAKQQTAEVA